MNTHLCQGCFLHSKLNKFILNKDALLLAIKIISKREKKAIKIINCNIILCTFDRKMHSGLRDCPGLHSFHFGFLCLWTYFWRKCQHLSLRSGPRCPQQMWGARFTHTDNRSGSSSNTELTQDDAVRTQIYSTAPPRGSAAPDLKLTRKKWLNG